MPGVVDDDDTKREVLVEVVGLAVEIGVDVEIAEKVCGCHRVRPQVGLCRGGTVTKDRPDLVLRISVEVVQYEPDAAAIATECDFVDGVVRVGDEAVVGIDTRAGDDVLVSLILEIDRIDTRYTCDRLLVTGARVSDSGRPEDRCIVAGALKSLWQSGRSHSRTRIEAPQR